MRKKALDEGRNQLNAKYDADRMLLVMDDQAGLFRNGMRNPVTNFLLKNRHYSCSVIVVTQAYKAVPKTVRIACSCLILFECPNLVELKSIYEEWPEGMNYEEWLRVYKYAIREPFSFMYINNKFKPGQRVFK